MEFERGRGGWGDLEVGEGREALEGGVLACVYRSIWEGYRVAYEERWCASLDFQVESILLTVPVL